MSTSAIAAQTELENVQRQAGAIIGRLDGRGWDLGGVASRWAATRVRMTNLATTFGEDARDLTCRAVLIEVFETGYTPPEAGPINELLFPSSGFQEQNYEKTLQAILGDGPWSERLGATKGRLPGKLSPQAKALAQRARDLALKGSPAGVRRRLNAIDKLGPTIGFNKDLFTANAAVWRYGAGGQNANVTVEVFGAHAHARAGLSADLKRRRFSASIDVGGEANLVHAHAHAGVEVGGDMAGAGANVDADAAVGANANARAGLTFDAMKGRTSGDVGVDAFAGAHADAGGSAEADLAGAKTTVNGSATAYAGVGIGVKADGNLDLLHGKFGGHFKVGAALGVGAKFDVGLNVDVSGVPHAIGHAASSVAHAVEHVVPHVNLGPIHFP